jgi:hypothetical protein
MGVKIPNTPKIIRNTQKETLSKKGSLSSLFHIIDFPASENKSRIFFIRSFFAIVS